VRVQSSTDSPDAITIAAEQSPAVAETSKIATTTTTTTAATTTSTAAAAAAAGKKHKSDTNTPEPDNTVSDERKCR